jgi:Flp pilus assembly protein TadG
MSRISSSSFKVNSDLEQLVSITNTTAIPVSDSTAQGSLSLIAGAVSGTEVQVDIVSAPTLNVSDSVAQGSLSTLAAGVSANQYQVNIAGSGVTVSTSDSTAQASLSTWSSKWYRGSSRYSFSTYIKCK